MLARHAAVRSVAVVAAPDERLGEIGYAYVVLDGEETFTLHDMREHLEQAGVTAPPPLALSALPPLTPRARRSSRDWKHRRVARAPAAAAMHEAPPRGTEGAQR